MPMIDFYYRPTPNGWKDRNQISSPLADKRMTRREFMLVFGGAVIVPSIGAHAQRSDRIRRIGMLMGTASDPETQSWFAAFRQKLHELGWRDGDNIRIDLRWGGGNIARIRALSEALVNSKPDVLMCLSVRVLKTLKQKTRGCSSRHRIRWPRGW
jgi:hypothetical protein